MKVSRENLLTLSKYAIKMGMAATLAAVIAQKLHLRYPIYAMIAPIIIMGTTRGSTWSAGISRIKGTIIGIITGAIFETIFGSNPLSILAASTLVIFLCRYWELGEAYRLAGYVTAIVVLEHSDQPWLYAWGRFLETALGIGVALLINTYLWPSPATENLAKSLTQILIDMEKLYQIVFNCYITGEYHEKEINDLRNSIISSLREEEKLWPEAKREQSGLFWVDESWEFLIRRLWAHISTMNNIALDSQENSLLLGLAPQLTQLAHVTSMSFRQLVEAVSNKQSFIKLPELEQACYVADKQIESLQQVENNHYPLGEMLRFASFFYNMEAIARDLLKMSDHNGEKQKKR
ncbi:FUSC family protein [Aetokthonos hydrillicola Thurmond2011]|jgi:uncharacterized membrane protein YgaE (UPF0421/DUF939 family)|uniref:FUSC family protein n=1 Tax=Aetokthonos hydrillicola Thurmond2011 TaxID=2712845 RepID=A0AAP5IAD3_9CYAN|nr:FUSC family protein [Aetokthonos hydrillicola]MBO3457855.1 hypothetical protein [Aetokthonos hydrillicola CCALA 1050]MBW4587341.1 FUSC family protein [Aetokthonos hydrillicola CCALA 1050]MDR9896634.1 FUSC family protein [Aetokthonos hydrillicola Thurmond2011]